MFCVLSFQQKSCKEMYRNYAKRNCELSRRSGTNSAPDLVAHYILHDILYSNIWLFIKFI